MEMLLALGWDYGLAVLGGIAIMFCAGLIDNWLERRRYLRDSQHADLLWRLHRTL